MDAIKCYPVLAAVLLTSGVHADESVRVARYSTVEPAATAVQANPLNVVIKIRFPRVVTTLDAAFDHLLHRSGYQLAEPASADPYLGVLLAAPLPEVHRDLGPITLENALSTLAGSAWRLVVDPVHRLVSFELAARYRQATVNRPAPRDGDSDLIAKGDTL